MPAGPGRNQLTAMARLARILAALDNADGAVTAARLIEVAGYGEAAPQDQLSADLRNLRSQGWQIDTVTPPGEPGKYRMVSGDNRLIVKLSKEQRAALQRAVILANRADLAKRLGVEPQRLPKPVGAEVVPHQKSVELSRALQAVQSGSRIRFTYKGSPRVVHPGTVRYQNYQWYLSGIEDGDDKIKHFAVGRMSDVSLDKPHTAVLVPDVQRLTLHPLRWQIDSPTQVTVRTASDYVPDVIRWLSKPDAQHDQDGVVDLTYTVTNRASFRARIYVLGPRVTVVGSDGFRDEMLAELRAMVGA